MSNNKYAVLIIVLVLVIIYGIFHIFTKPEIGVNYKSQLDSLQSKIDFIVKEKDTLRIQNDSLKVVSTQLQVKFSSLEIRKEKIIENSSKEDTSIKYMLDPQLFKLFTEFDSLNRTTTRW